jgi:flavin-dependent dehydrogenase
MFHEMLDSLHLDGDRYLLRHFPQLGFDGFPIACDLATIHKPRLLRELRGPAPVRYEAVDTAAYDVVADCTGSARALLPAPEADCMVPCLQYRIRRDLPQLQDAHPRLRFVREGYAWSFPLGNTIFHIGIGSITEDLAPCLERVGFLQEGDRTVCSCRSSVRVSAPGSMLPYHAGNIWGVGESIGTVSPLVGDGILPSMRCAVLFGQLLLTGDLGHYEERVQKEFSWMERERDVIDGMVARNGQLALGDLLLMRDHASRFGLQIGLRWVVSWMVGRRILGRFP